LNELHDIALTAVDHFKECILPRIRVKNRSLNTSLYISASTSCLPMIVAPEFKIEDRLLIDSQRKKISELESKVINTTFFAAYFKEE